MLVSLTLAATRREPFEVKILRAKGMPFALEGDRIRNLYTIRIQNKRHTPLVNHQYFADSIYLEHRIQRQINHFLGQAFSGLS